MASSAVTFALTVAQAALFGRSFYPHHAAQPQHTLIFGPIGPARMAMVALNGAAGPHCAALFSLARPHFFTPCGGIFFPRLGAPAVPLPAKHSLPPERPPSGLPSAAGSGGRPLDAERGDFQGLDCRMFTDRLNMARRPNIFFFLTKRPLRPMMMAIK